jgi:hypothetical protein
MPSLSNSFRMLKEGLDRRLFWTYWIEFKEKGWEVFWGPTLLGVAFGIYTLWHSPAWPWFLLYVLAVVFLTGYYLWRVNHVRLEKKVYISRVFPRDWTIAQGWANAGHNARVYCLEVVNQSEGETVEGVSVQLSGISPQVPNFDFLPITLHLQHDNPTKAEDQVRSFNLNPREPKNIDFVSSIEGDNRFSVTHVVAGVNPHIPFDTN